MSVLSVERSLDKILSCLICADLNPKSFACQGQGKEKFWVEKIVGKTEQIQQKIFQGETLWIMVAVISHNIFCSFHGCSSCFEETSGDH